MQFVEEQAIDRVHRLNQTLDVVVYKLTVANTVEERILALQEKKRALAEAAIEGKAVGKLSMKDILNLFRRDAESHDDHGDGELGAKVGILRKEEGAGVGGRESELEKWTRVRVPEKGKSGAREESVYSRRW